MKVRAITVEVARLELKPGDTLLVKCKETPPIEFIQYLEEQLKPHLPEGVGTLIIMDELLEFSVMGPERDGSDAAP